MNCSSVLVVGGGDVGRSAAVALARLGLEVSLIDRVASQDEDQGEDEDVALRRTGVEVRPDLRLVGLVDVDSHVEAELSSGHVENFDVVLAAEGEATEPVGSAESRRVAVIRSAADAEAVARRFTRTTQSD